MSRVSPHRFPLHVIVAVIALIGLLGPILASESVGAQATPPASPASNPTQINVELILDASGSMAEEISPGVTRIDAAKSVLTDVIKSLPTTPGINVGFRVYGHKGSNTTAGKAVSCQSSELRVPVEGVDKDALQDEVDAYQPVGWTPIALSLNRAGADFPHAGPNVRNAVVLVTDGLETCGGNPCNASRQLVNGPAGAVTHVIGFALSDEEASNLQCIVDASGGLLLDADNANELSAALFKVLDELDVVHENGQLEIESIGGVFPHATVSPAVSVNGTPTAATPSATPFAATFGDSNTMELPSGTYTVSWPTPAGTMEQTTVEVDPNQTTVIRGSILRFPQANGAVYQLKDQAGLLIWNAPIEYGDSVWLLPGIYRLAPAEVVGNLAIVSLDVQTQAGSVTQIDASITP